MTRSLPINFYCAVLEGPFSYFANYPHPMSLFLLFLLALMRIVPIVVFAPFYGAKLVPGPAKMGLSLSIAAVFLPHIASLTTQIVQFNVYYCFLALKELLIGTALGFLVSAPFQVASVAGVLIDYQRGSSQLTSLDPTLGTQASPLGQLLNYMMIVIFFAVNGADYFMEGVALSYNIIPADQMVPVELIVNKHTPFWTTVINLIQYIMTMATQLAAPSLVAIFMADLFLGIANRLASQVPMSFLGWALKSLAGLFFLWIGWFFILKLMEKGTIHYMRDFLSLLLDYAKPGTI